MKHALLNMLASLLALISPTLELEGAGPRPGGGAPDSMRSVAPEKFELGTEWGERQVIWVVDPLDDPVEFVNEGGDRDAILTLMRAAIVRNGSVAMAEFWYRHSQHHFPVEVTISRYPDRQSLDKNWKELSAKFDRKASTKAVGESAAWLQTAQTNPGAVDGRTYIQNRIFVFRQGLFTGWVDGVAELGEQPLLDLAEAVADKMAAGRERWDEMVCTAVKNDAGGYSASFGDVCTFHITVDRPYEVLARRQRGWPFVLEYQLEAPDGASELSISFSTSDVRSSDEEVSKAPGFWGIERRTIRVGSQEVVFREWSAAEVHYADASARLDLADSYSQVPVVIGIKAHAKDRRKALKDALQSVRLEGLSEPFPPRKGD
jgi:hypothetical protein